MSSNSNQRMFINKDVGKFIINESKTIRDAINLYGNNYGLTLIVINNNDEFVGTLSNGDIRIFLAKRENKVEDSIKRAVNKNAK